MTRDLKHEIVEANDEIFSVVRSLADDVGRYKRERNRALKAVVSEVYSAPRNTEAIKLLPELCLITGFALDLTTIDEDDECALDFDSPRKREKAISEEG